MRRKSLSGAACPIARSLDVIGDWWSLLIVRDALRGMRRFSEFHKSLGVSKNILTRRLRTLVEQRHPRAGPGVRRQRLSGIPADREGPRPVPGARGARPMGAGEPGGRGRAAHGPGRSRTRPAGPQARGACKRWPAPRARRNRDGASGAAAAINCRHERLARRDLRGPAGPRHQAGLSCARCRPFAADRGLPEIELHPHRWR